MVPSEIIGPANIKIEVRQYSFSNRISMRVCLPDKIILSCPLEISERLIKEFIKKNEYWLLEKKKLIDTVKKVEVGLKIPFKGDFFEICQSNKPLDACSVVHQKIFVSSGDRPVGLQIRDFFMKEARKVAVPMLDAYSKSLGKNYKGVKFKDTKSRWGSCTQDRSIMISWRLIMAPEEVLNYVLAHEAAHLLHMNHSKTFWETVCILCNDYKIMRNWIRCEARNLFIYKFV